MVLFETSDCYTLSTWERSVRDFDNVQAIHGWDTKCGFVFGILWRRSQMTTLIEYVTASTLHAPPDSTRSVIRHCRVALPLPREGYFAVHCYDLKEPDAVSLTFRRLQEHGFEPNCVIGHSFPRNGTVQLSQNDVTKVLLAFQPEDATPIQEGVKDIASFKSLANHLLPIERVSAHM